MFGYHKFDTFPIDTWVRKFVSNNFDVKDNIKDISSYMRNKMTAVVTYGLDGNYIEEYEALKQYTMI